MLYHIFIEIKNTFIPKSSDKIKEFQRIESKRTKTHYGTDQYNVNRIG